MRPFKKTLRRRGALMAFGLVMPLALVSGCVSVSTRAICEGTSDATDAHAAALLGVSVPDEAVISGDKLIAQLDAACRR